MSDTKQPHSRRRGPAKTMLSRQRIVDTTIEIMRREGLRKATMRRVAQELDTGAASLYVYVRNTGELHAAVIDELLGTIDDPGTGTWQQQLVELVTDYRDVLMRDHGLARSALVIRPNGPHLLALFDRMMTLLIEGGVEPVSAAWGADMLLLHATAIAAEHAAPEDGDADAGDLPDDVHHALTVAVQTADSTSTPALAEHADAVMAGSPAQRWAWTLNTLIAGIAAGERPPIP
ncbi:TetR/AcrR family transcriptional regulator [uncultured Gordonia sp.]|uniref:TetR/AcrR family transcriptional regulator n=1 Tax=uncultured Gordonia sp. TaxID=198437 RepID=UPI0025905CFD|nr:TetR/AcrR family transcriptional regulator [uncultured Gordonia sp.]